MTALKTVEPKRNFSFKDVHVDGARAIAEASRDAGVKRLVHFSALNAEHDSPSAFLRSKVRGGRLAWGGGEGGASIALFTCVSTFN